MHRSLFKIYKYILCILALVSLSLPNAQDARVIDNKGTIRPLFVPSVSEQYPSASQTVVEAVTFTALSFGSQDFAPTNTDYTNTASGIQVLNGGRYKITYRVTSEVVNNNRAGGEFRLTLNGTAIANTLAYTYQRNNLVDKNTVTVVKIMDLSENDLIGVEGRVYDSNRGPADELTIVPEGTMLTVEKVD